MILEFEISLLGLVVEVLDVFLALVPEVLTKLSLLGVFGHARKEKFNFLGAAFDFL
jgi:hypothetical protein